MSHPDTQGLAAAVSETWVMGRANDTSDTSSTTQQTSFLSLFRLGLCPPPGMENRRSSDVERKMILDDSRRENDQRLSVNAFIKADGRQKFTEKKNLVDFGVSSLHYICWDVFTPVTHGSEQVATANVAGSYCKCCRKTPFCQKNPSSWTRFL